MTILHMRIYHGAKLSNGIQARVKFLLAAAFIARKTTCLPS